MCLAVPMLVIELDDPGPFPLSSSAVVEAGGIRRRIRLDIVDIPPCVGDYVIVHAGYAIRTLTPEDARINLGLLREAAELSGDGSF